MKELPTLPPTTNYEADESAVHADDSGASHRPTLPVDTELEIATPHNGSPSPSKAPDTHPAPQGTRIVSPFIIEGSLADGVEPLPVARSND